jgi:hypothetical protein
MEALNGVLSDAGLQLLFCQGVRERVVVPLHLLVDIVPVRSTSVTNRQLILWRKQKLLQICLF